MKRLWVQLGLMIAGILFFVFFLQFLEIMFGDGPPVPGTAEAQFADNDMEQREIARRLLDFMGLSLVVGLGGGLIIGRVVSAPLIHISHAAQRVGQGDLAMRVPVRGSTEMMELAQAFNRMAADLHHAETVRRNLMADVSHELRTPLTVLDGNLRAALDHVYALDEADIANLYAQTRHLIRLVNDLRELALAESGQLLLEKHPTDLNTLLVEMVQTLEPLAMEKEIALRHEAAVLPPIVVDASRIRQVLFNLLGNALLHTPAGGQICLRGAVQAGMVHLVVQDSGVGLAPEQITAVFDRFYRADKSRSRDTGGTGLGLAIAKTIVEAHGGRIQAHSAGTGEGCTFTVTLPLFTPN